MQTTLYEPEPTYPFIAEVPAALGGANPKTSFVDSSGRRWLFKFQSDDVTLVDVVASAIAERVGVPSPTIYPAAFDFGGQPYRGSVQPFLNFMGTSLSRTLMELPDAQRQVLQCHQVVDWLLSNPDTHRGQFLILSDDTLVAVDKAQSLRLFPHDRLQWESLLYPLNDRRSVYYYLFQSMRAGRYRLDPQVALAFATQVQTRTPPGWLSQVWRPAVESWPWPRQIYASIPPMVKIFPPFGHSDLILDKMERRRERLVSDFESLYYQHSDHVWVRP